MGCSQSSSAGVDATTDPQLGSKAALTSTTGLSSSASASASAQAKTAAPGGGLTVTLQPLQRATNQNEEASAGSVSTTARSSNDDHHHHPQVKQQQKPAQRVEQQGQQPSKSKLKPGYSSGGSSYSTEDEEEIKNAIGGGGSGDGVNNINTAAGLETSMARHDTLVNIKNELKAESDIACGVVRIETDFGREIDDVYEGVHDGLVLGTGIAGVVRKVKHRETGVNFAVKCLNLGLIEQKGVLDSLREEIFIMSQLDHPNILRLEEVYESETQIYLIQELCHGGDLFDRLDDQPEIHFTEVDCAKLVKQMLSSVRYLHSKGIVHRDLKLENFLFESDDLSDNSLKMIDFGLSKHFQHTGQVLHDAVGTPYAAAPEIIRGSYDEKVDIWSMGVITYLLLSGESPFGGIDDEPLTAVRDNILACNVCFEPDFIWDHVSSKGKKFVKRLLNPNPTDRPTAREAQQDEWLHVYANKDTKDCDPLNPKIVNNLCQFKEFSALHKVLLEVLSFSLLPEQIIDLRKEFVRFDPNGVGEITLDELKQVLLNSAESGSLGALSDTEVEDIFNALRVREKDTTIRWHEFIAAGVSQSDFDDRNLRLAFDRLDYDRKGYITREDLHEMLSTNDGRMDKSIFSMWQDGLEEVHCQGKGRMDFDDFRRFLKGQVPKEPLMSGAIDKKSSLELSPRASLSSSLILTSASAMQTVPEGSVSPMTPRDKVKSLKFGTDANLQMPALAGIPSPDGSLSPLGQEKKAVDISIPPDLLPLPTGIVRSSSVRLPGSQSWLDDDSMEEIEEAPTPALESSKTYMRNAVNKFRRLSGQGEFSMDAASPAAANDALFKAHRDFRRAVFEASKVFEQKKRAREVTTPSPSAKMTMRGGRRSVVNYGSPPSDENSTVADATRRSGRPRQRHARKRTASDISGLLK
eukprot:CAMPEP_0113518152 /NCGR_PEP_ID=MMETSP0014_2-20120614/42701_1 /TAXON_ID=2857 /ORGANISM="Nitzschia sp." /LENGTH=918 /DNA_ID=CAMNT_0000415519 /DNA_START=164 /DNA_END=2920 /DNA_ORIENTATION=- /assembly_acc=CAM_ASM_000159